VGFLYKKKLTRDHSLSFSLIQTHECVEMLLVNPFPVSLETLISVTEFATGPVRCGDWYNSVRSRKNNDGTNAQPRSHVKSEEGDSRNNRSRKPRGGIRRGEAAIPASSDKRVSANAPTSPASAATQGQNGRASVWLHGPRGGPSPHQRVGHREEPWHMGQSACVLARKILALWHRRQGSPLQAHALREWQTHLPWLATRRQNAPQHARLPYQQLWLEASEQHGPQGHGLGSVPHGYPSRHSLISASLESVHTHFNVLFCNK